MPRFEVTRAKSPNDTPFESEDEEDTHKSGERKSGVKGIKLPTLSSLKPSKNSVLTDSGKRLRISEISCRCLFELYTCMHSLHFLCNLIIDHQLIILTIFQTIVDVKNHIKINRSFSRNFQGNVKISDFRT